METLVQRYSSCDLVMSYAVCLRLVPLFPVHFKARLWLDLDMLGLSVSAGQSSSAAARAATRPTKSHNGVVAACALQCLCQLEMLRGGRYVLRSVCGGVVEDMVLIPRATRCVGNYVVTLLGRHGVVQWYCRVSTIPSSCLRTISTSAGAGIMEVYSTTLASEAG